MPYYKRYFVAVNATLFFNTNIIIVSLPARCVEVAAILVPK